MPTAETYGCNLDSELLQLFEEIWSELWEK